MPISLNKKGGIEEMASGEGRTEENKSEEPKFTVQNSALNDNECNSVGVALSENVRLSDVEDEFEETQLEQLVKKVDAYIEQSKFGDYGKFFRPFSRKFKSSLRTKFEDDIEIYDRVDANEHDSVGSAWFMRLTTFVLFAFNSAFFVVISCLVLGVSGSELGGRTGAVLLFVEQIGFIPQSEPSFGLSSYLSLLIAVFLFSYLLRHLFREFFLSRIREGVASLAAFVIGRLNGLNAAVTNALDNSDSDRQPRADWPRKAADWIRVALWYEERYEEVDRYISATAWRVENTFRYIETTFRLVNVAVSIFVLLIIWDAANAAAPDISRLPIWIGAAVYLVFSIGAWSFGLKLGTRQYAVSTGDSLWGDVFGEKFSDFDKEKRHVFNRIAGRVSNDKTTIIDSSPRMSPQSRDNPRFPG